jgi:EAL domain-containing protein (putative c-di-GMP-specific phosphodiesterase class I)
MELIRGLDASLPRRVIVSGVVRMCEDLGITVIAEGIETAEELAILRQIGVRYIQGYHLARPAFQALPEVILPAAARKVA